MNDNITVEEHLPSPAPRHRRFTVTFFGTPINTTLTSTASVVRKWIYRMRYFYRSHWSRLVVGLGVQWRPFTRGVEFPAATLQLCIGRRCLIFQLLHKNSIPNILVRFLNNPNIKFVGIRNGTDAPMLQKDHGLRVTTKDLRFLAASRMNSRGLRGASMEILANDVLGRHGVKKPTEIGRSRWDARYLSEEQVQYACIDAHISFEIGKALNAWK